MTDQGSKDTAADTGPTIPSDATARRQWAEEFTDDLMDHPHDEEASWVQRERGRQGR